MIKFDKLKVTHITIEDKIYAGYKWCDDKPRTFCFFGLIEKSEGYCAGFWEDGEQGWLNDCLTDIGQNKFAIADTLYRKPKVKVYINETCVGSKYFNKLEQAVKWCQDEFRNIDYSVS
jgi:hypothetical protein